MSGTEGAWVPLVVSALGTGASLYGQQQAANEKRDILNNQLLQSKKAQDKTSELVADEGKKYNAANRNAELEQQQAQTVQQETKDLGAAPTIIDGAGDAGAVSSDYIKAKADKAVTEGNRLTSIAREVAKTRAPGQLMTAEGLRRANLTGDLQSIWGSAANGKRAAEMQVEDVQSPLYGQLGALASSLASAYGAGGTAGGSSSSATYGLNAGDASLGDYAGSQYSLAGNSSKPSFWNSGTGGIKFGRG